MKEGWEYKTLGEVVSFSRGLTYKKSDEVDYSTKVVLRSTNINVDNNSLNIDELKYLNENIEVEEEKLIKKGAILICMSNGSKKHLGKVALIEHDYKYAFGGFMGLLTPVIKINSKYLYYTLTTPKYKEYIKSLSEGANINNLKIKDIQKYIIPIFPLDEQRRIVSYLDSSFKLIDEIKNKALKSLTEAKALFQSALAEAMEPKEGWEEKTFGEICTYHKEQKRENGYKYIGMENIESGTGNLIGYGATDNVLSSTFFFKKGEVLYGRLRPYLKKVYIAEFDGCCSTEIFPIKTNGVLPGLIKYWFLTDEITNKINDTSAGCRMPRGNMNEVLQFHLYIPSDKQSQMQIVSHLDKLSSKVRAIEEKYQKMVEECDALKQAMLRDVFE